MNTIAQWLKEKGKIVIPKTLDTQVFDENGKSLDRRLKTAKDEQVIQLPKVDPSMIFSDLDYSTEEQLTGKRWIDGKPIYQKSFEFETGDGTQNRSIYEDKNSFLVDINSNMNNVTEGSYYKYIESDNTDGLRISFHQSSQYSNKTYNITIQYTKTTDTASSPVATPKVEAKHVYSTEEKVVGTWIDGKPLYQKTYIVNPTSGTSINIDISDLNYENFADIKGIWNTLTNDNHQPLYYNTSSDRFRAVVADKTLQIIFAETVSRLNLTLAITLQYTKTTDTVTA